MLRSKALGLLSLVLLCSCSSKKTLSDSELEDVAGFCAEWASRACNDDVVDLCAASSAASCAATQADFCATLVPEDLYSRPAAADCLNAVEKAYADGELTPEERALTRHLGGVCGKVASGSIGRDGICSQDSDCDRTKDFACVKKGSAKGTCQEPVATENGGDCTAVDTVCSDGYYCDATVLHCIEGKKEGAVCSASTPCGVGLRCADGDGTTLAVTATTDGTCVARGDVGKTCETDDQCATGICTPRANGGGVCSAKTVLSPSDPVCADLE
jgi:hypothetical protein